MEQYFKFGKTVLEKILKLLYPSRCPICDEIWQKEGQYCCPDCGKKLPWIRGAACKKCGKPVKEEQEYCSDCRKQNHRYTQGAAAFTYSKGLPDAIYRMKYQNRRDYLDFFADAIMQNCQKQIRGWNPQLILPVPMHWRKRSRRGYNQSELLAEKIGALAGIPVERQVLKCVRMTSAQKTLSRKERQKNLKGSFQLCCQLHKVKRVLLVDDVYTTGSTMDEIAGILQAAGVKEIYFVVICTGQKT